MKKQQRYLEYRFKRGQIFRFHVSRTCQITLAKPTGALLRLVGKKFKEQTEDFREEWGLEVRVTDVRPDWSALCKSQVTEAKRFLQEREVPFPAESNPTTLYLNETVDRFGLLSEHQGTLPTSVLVPFSEAAVGVGESWSRSRREALPIFAANGQVRTHEARQVDYLCTVVEFGKVGGMEVAEVTLTGESTVTEEPDLSQRFEASGRIHFALREGHILRAEVVRASVVTLGGMVLTHKAQEKFKFSDSGTEQTVGGMKV